MIKLKSETETPSRRSRLPRLFVLLVLVVFAILLLEKCLGHWALSRWKSRMAAQGEIFEADRLWPQPTAQGRAFSNQMQQAIAQLHPGLNRYAGLVSGIVVQEPGLARRGSQEPSPVLNPSRDETNIRDRWRRIFTVLHAKNRTHALFLYQWPHLSKLVGSQARMRERRY